MEGETYAVTLTLDTTLREIAPPEDLAEALAAAGVRAAWDALSYAAKPEAAEAVTGARRPETQAKRIAAIVGRLRG